MRRLIPLQVAAALLLLASTRSPALDPNRTLNEFGHQAWTTENGLPQNTVQAIVQTQDGYLWIGTQEGLVRFDGLNFAVFDKENTPAFKSNDIRFLQQDRQGRLWISTSYGLVCRHNGLFAGYTINEGLPDNSVGPIVEDANGNVWIGTAAGLARFENGKFKTFTIENGLSRNVVQLLTARANGTLLVGTSAGLQALSGDSFTNITIGPDILPANITAIAETLNGQLWLGTLNGLFAVDGNGRANPVPLPNNRVNALCVDRNGTLWIGTAAGLARVRNGKVETFTAADGLTSNLVLSVFEDREGSIWIGTEAGGLNQLKSKKFNTYTTRQGLPSDLVKAIYQDSQGGIWIGSNGGGLTLFKDGKFTTWTTKDGLSSDVVLSLTSSADGTLWIGTPDGLNRFRDGVFQTFTFADGLSNDLVRSVFVDRSGVLWVGTRDGLNSFRDNEFRTYTTQDGLANNFIGAIYEDSKGNLWVGTLGGLSKLKDGVFQTFTTNEGLSSNTVISLYEDAAGDLWIGTNGGGLNRLRAGKFVSFTNRNSLAADVIYRILEDKQQNLWCSSNKGIFRVSKAELERVATGASTSVSPVYYGPADGTLTRESSGGGHPAGWKTSDGRIWFATIKGLAVIDPENIPLNTTPPPIAVEQLFVDNEAVSTSQKLSLSPGTSRLDFYYTALSFIAPENVRFKYKLEGFDDDWIDAGAKRVASYTNLRPGNYTFRVIAANNDGVWNESGAAVQFYLQPRFYQTYWFYLLVALLLALAAWQLYRLRVKRMAFEFRAVLAERNRIAREIHDNLAQDILGISVQLELVARLMPAAAESAKGHLDRARMLVRNSMTEARRYVWDLRSEELRKKDLPAALSDTTKRLTADTGVEAVVDISGPLQPLPVLVETNLLRIGQEAVNNAVKHAHATRIDVALNFDTRHVRLSISDNGRGFDPQQQIADGHFGLLGMRERADQIGGTLTIESANERGTQIAIDVPLNHD
ncbi:MAG TPA: two-component regulator propeller domain-containing protein [Pyrinomonadaceae bacterium]|nr:two-component regulator propeller domain-containing protein [Pyrinomonadaceae bacterium]